MTRPISDDSMKTFQNLGLDKFENLALVSVSIGGVSCDAISVIYEDEEDGSVLINPVLIVVSDDVFKLMEGPDDAETFGID